VKKATVYCHENTYNVYELHRKTIEQTDKGITIIEQLSGFADNLFAAWKDRNPVCKGQINNWHPDYIGKDLDVIFQPFFKYEDAQLAIAKDCGFLDWQEVEVEEFGQVPFNLAFTAIHQKPGNT